MKRYYLTLFIAFILINVLFSTTVYGKNLTLKTGGRVSVELITSEAEFHNTLALASPLEAGLWARGCNIEPITGLGADNLHLLMSEKTSQHGCRAELDADWVTSDIEPFTAGTELEFNLCAQTDSDPDCDHIWSSDPDKNPDNFDHVNITELHASEWPGKVYQLAWEDKPEDESDKDFNDLIAVVRVSMDTDEDGLWDDWEKYGVDADADGSVDLDLPALGADPLHRDIFLEIDYMDCTKGGDCKDTHSHKPKTAAVNSVVQAFASAPVSNPDGKKGINLHIDVDDAVPHQNDSGKLDDNNNKFDQVKNNPAYFGQSNPRRFAYHYALFVHQLSGDSTSGQGERGGNDFVVSLGGWNQGSGDTDGDGLPDEYVGTVQQQAGSLMHELGHNLDLHHGGEDSVNYKPNYLSVMNYHYQFTGILPDNRIDYSRQALATLNESSLNETEGIGDGTDKTLYDCPGGFKVGKGNGTGPIDWNCDGDGGQDTDVKVNLNYFDCSDCYTKLKGFDDWANLKYDFQNDNDFEDGRHLDVDIPDMDFLTYLRITQRGEIRGMKWEDLNGNGALDPGEPGLPGWEITLEDEGGDVIATTTDANGNYNFTGLIGGNYTVGETLMPGYIRTVPADPATYTIKVENNSIVENVDFGNFRLGEIHGMKWEDLNANGMKDPDEEGLAGWEINIKGTDTITGEEVNITASTDTGGNYSFRNLTAGIYVITETLKDKWVRTVPGSGNYTITITSGAAVTGRDFGNFKKGRIIGGGWIPVPGGPKAAFGLEGQYPDRSNTSKGNVEYQDLASELNIKSVQINTVATTTDRRKGVITGIARVNGEGSYPFEVHVEDNGYPGKGKDVFKILLPAYAYGATLSSGNIQILE